MDGKKVSLDLNAKKDSELAKSLTEDIHDAFEGLDLEFDLKFKD